MLLSRSTTSKRESDGCYRSCLQRVVHQPMPRVPPGPAVALPIQDKVGQHEVAILMACPLRIGDTLNGPWKTSVGSFLIPGRNVNLALAADAAFLYNIEWFKLWKVPHPLHLLISLSCTSPWILPVYSLKTKYWFMRLLFWRRHQVWNTTIQVDSLLECELCVQAQLMP